jgi:hypothetical protein
VAGKIVEFEEGDWVKPIFGGRRMSLLRLEGTGAVCSWMIDSKEQIAWVDLSCLKRCGREGAPATARERKMSLSGNGIVH